jgi:hypothetical protein
VFSDDAPIPFDSADVVATPEKRPLAEGAGYMSPPAAPPAAAPPKARAGEAADESVDKGAFYDEPDAGVGANRPKPQAASARAIYIDNKHRVFNDEGLILVVCGICGTRVHFPADKGETKQQCPDCFIKFTLPKLPPGPVKSKPAPAPMEEDEFKLEETFERQGYQPLQRDSIAAELVRGPVAPLPGTAPAGMMTPGAGGTAVGNIPHSNGGGTSTAGTSPPMGGVIPPPLPPAMSGTGAPTSYPAPLPIANSTTTPVASNNVGGGSMIDPSNRLGRPPAWALLVGVFGFAFRPLHLLCLVSFSIMVMIPIVGAVLAMAAAPAFAPIFIFGIVPPLEAAPFVFIASYFVHIVHDSSYGENEVKGWNALAIVDNGIMAIYVFCAFFFAGLPGFLLSLPVATSNGALQFLMIVVSTVAFFPFCLLSLLEEESYWQVYNHEVALSFRRSANQVFLFFCTLLMFTVACFGLMSIAACVGGLSSEEPNLVVILVVLAAMVTIGMYWTITYARLIGRLAWVMNYEAQFGEIDDDE